MANEVVVLSRRGVVFTLCIGAFATACGKTSPPASESARSATHADSPSTTTAARHLTRPLSHVPEAGDLQRLVVFDANGLMVQSAATGELMPLQHAGELDDSDFADDSVIVATVTADANFPDLGLTAGEEDSLYLFKEAAHKWVASMNHNGVKKKLTVAHYKYAATTDKDFPNTARFDVLNNKQVIGVRCGAAWCMIGDLGASTDGSDPADNGILSPVTHRVRGWFDKKERSATPAYSYAIYPIVGLAKKKRSDYKDKFDQVATIQSATTPSITADVWLSFDTQSRQWIFEYRRAGYVPVRRTFKARTLHRERRVPGSARWDKSDAGLKTPTLISLGDLWVRCANGCCSSEAIMPDVLQ